MTCLLGCPFSARPIDIKEDLAMQISVSSTLTVYHDGRFWAGVAEHVEGGRCSACRMVFGAEPSDGEVLRLVCEKRPSLAFRGSLEAEPPEAPGNPKRRMREAARHGASTRSQLALSEAREAAKKESKAKRAEATRRESERERFERRQAKRKLRKRGR